MRHIASQYPQIYKRDGKVIALEDETHSQSIPNTKDRERAQHPETKERPD